MTEYMRCPHGWITDDSPKRTTCPECNSIDEISTVEKLGKWRKEIIGLLYEYEVDLRLAIEIGNKLDELWDILEVKKNEKRKTN